MTRTSTSPRRFGPLGPTPFRDSRCSFPLLLEEGLDQDWPVWLFPEFTWFIVDQHN